VLGFLQQRFGISQTVFDDYHLFKRGATIWIFSMNKRLSEFASLRVESVGLPLLRSMNTRPKPTSASLQLFGSHANKNIATLGPQQLQKLAEIGEIRCEFPASPGYVIVVVTGAVIGCGLYVPGRLISQFPRHLFTPQTWEYFLLEQGD
jgi:NOL1/NOP2/fmu family ribosome biogenesis protein